MKKVLVIFLAVLTSSCSKELQEQADELKVSPPAWLHGSWNNKDEASGNKGWKFTAGAAVQIDAEGNETNILAGFFLLTALTGEEVTVEEFNSQGFYSIRITSETSADRRFDFSRISDQEMSWDNAQPLNMPERYLKIN
ncbi:hypothetical protein [Robiginitalea sp. SC105]|uniref:hypothetical protein n=1 Tax=Robiginitalea sp. SC105 TaxID=2762332 RepID=UPI00163AB169|nr:hypothetical protein [Robiginitalea sp. SC105]MBC2838851.1 hypothetical protein [Robiginitalea sp. SC105]